MVNSTSPNRYQLLRFRTLCYNVTFLGKQLVRVKKSISKTDVKRGMAIIYVITVSSSSGKTWAFTSVLLKVTGIRRISSVQILSKTFLFYVED